MKSLHCTSICNFRYVAWTGEYEIGSDGDETPMQRYQRLNCEVRELLEELEKLRESTSEKKEPIGGLAQQVKGLHEQLASLRLEEMLGADLLRNLSDPQGHAKEKLLHQLQELAVKGPSPKANGDAKEGKGTSGAGGGATYELFLKPELSKLQDQVHMAQLDKRLEKLEKVIGGTDEQMGALSMETNQKSLMGAIGVLSSRTSLLDPGHLDHVEGRLFALQQKMNAVAEKKQVIDDTEKQNKISELYELVQKSEGMSSALPDIVDRLETLEGLHDQALQFTKALSQLDSVQEQLKHSLDNNAALLTETQKKFADNLGNIQQNFTAVEKRLEKLGK